MSEKILYILGAGASAQALPLARSVYAGEKLIPGLAQELRSTRFDTIFSNSIETREKFHNKFNKLADKADEFGDVDTYAKYLYLLSPSGKELQDIKRTLSEYFIIKEIILKARDPRYLPWLVSIMDRKIFPENVKIISWNYDYQVQLASAQIGDLEDVKHSVGGFSYSPSMLAHLPNLDPTFSDHNKLSLIQLNGIANFVYPKNAGVESAFQEKYNGNIISLLQDEHIDLNSAIHFAWDNSGYHQDLLKHIKTMMSGTTILVVIGYSFPFFNRIFDKQIIQLLKETGTFKKIYFQDPKLNGQQLRSQFQIEEKIDIVHIGNTSNFFIPFEY